MRTLTSIVTFLLATPVHADVLTVGTGFPPSDHPTIQAAVDAAANGDTIAVRAGSYPAFTVSGKELTIVAVSDIVVVSGTITVRDLGPAQSLLVQALNVSAREGPDAPALLVEDCAGPVRFADCRFRGSSYISYGGDGAVLRDSDDVAFVRCALEGGNGAHDFDGGGCLCALAWPGGSGLVVEGGTAVLSACRLRGGAGGFAEGTAGDGGHGCSVSGGTLSSEECRFLGGDGGNGWTSGGDGGHGLLADSASTIYLRNDISLGGAGNSCCPPGADGAPFVLDGDVVLFTAGTTHLFVDSPVHEAQPTLVAIRGAPGTLAFAAIALHDALQPALGYSGWLLVGHPVQIAFIGVIPESSQLAGQVVVPLLPPGVEVLPLRLQGLAASPQGEVSLTNWTPLVILPAVL